MRGQVQAIKRVATVSLGKMVQPSPASTSDVEAQYLRAAHVQPEGRHADAEEKTMWFSPQELRDLNLASGDVVVVEGGAGYGRSAYIASPMEGWGYQNSIIRVRPRPGLSEGRFLNYVFQSLLFTGETALAASVATIPHYTADKVRATRHWMPNVEAQGLIADFLDRETAQIDAMIEAQADVVQLAQEHRAAVVAEEIEALSRKGVEMVALRYCLRVQAGVTLGKQYDSETSEYPYVRVANVQAGYLNLEVVKTVRVSPTVAAASTLQPGDVLITEGGDRAALGRGALWRGEIPEALHQNHIFALRCGPLLDPEFLVYVLDAPDARIYFESTRRQTTNLSSTNSAKVKAFKTPLPPISDQEKIVKRLNRVLSQVDSVIVSAQEVITLLRERREALITAAVTGRIDPVTGIERTDPATYKEAS